MLSPGDRDGDVRLERDLAEGVTPAETPVVVSVVLAVLAGEFWSVDCPSPNSSSFPSSTSSSSSTRESCELRRFGFAAAAVDGSPFLPASKRLTRKAR